LAAQELLWRNNLKSKGQKELEEYVFTRKDVAKMLGVSPNAVRHRMRRGATTLEYRFDGSKFLFKRPRDTEPRGQKNLKTDFYILK